MKYLDKIYKSQDIISEFGEKKTIDGTSYYTSEFVYYNNFDANKTYSLDVYPFWKDKSNNYYKRTSTAVPAECEALVGLINHCYKNKDNGVDAAMTAYDVLKTGTKNTWIHSDGKLVTKTYTLQNYQVNGLSIRGSRQNIESDEVLDQDKYGSTDQPPYAKATPYSSGTSGKTLYWYGKNLSFSDGYLQFLGSIENSNWSHKIEVALPANSKKIVIGLTIPGNYSLSYNQGISINDRSTGFFNNHLFADLRFGNSKGLFSDFSEYKITGNCNVSSNSIKFYELDIPTGANAISFDSGSICFLSSNQTILYTTKYEELTSPVPKYNDLINSTETSSIDYEKTYNFTEGGYVVPGSGSSQRHSYYIAGAEDGWESGAIVWVNGVHGTYDNEKASFKYKITVSPQSWLINKPTAPYDLDLLNNVIAFDKPGTGTGDNGGVIFEHLLKFKMQLGFNPWQGNLFNFDGYTDQYLQGENSEGSRIKKYCNCSLEKGYGGNHFNLGAIVGVVSGWEDNSNILNPNTLYIVGHRVMGYGASVYIITG